MTPARRRLLDRLLDDLLEAEPATRQQALARLARRVPRLHRWLEELLQASTQPTRFLQTVFSRVGDAARNAPSEPEAVLPAGTRLGPWRLQDVVGSGGMGTVYRARRADGAFAMEVAVKLIRLRQKALDERLQQERELLARLDHRNIARLIDGGTTEDGQAYLVMEWVEGNDLDKYIRETGPGLDARLDLFEQIAEAVAHAHQRQIVHGDLKPANVRVTRAGQVRLLDFGVARLVVEGEEASESPVTALTPAFGAPEQFRGEVASTQSDVWSLGIVLAWLLGEAIPDPAGAPSMDDVLPPDIPGRPDLLAILAQACHAEPDERYAGVLQLLDDIRRHRSGFPVRARPRTRGYVLKLFARRHRVGVALGAMGSLALFLAVAGAVSQAYVATLERDRAEAEAQRALHAEQQSAGLAEDLQQVVDFQAEQLSRIDMALMGADLRQEIVDRRSAVLEHVATGPDDIARGLDALEQALAGVNFTDLARASLDENIFAHALVAIDEQFEDQPLVRATLLQSVTMTMRNLGLAEGAMEPQKQALEIRRRLLDNDHPDTLESINSTGHMLQRLSGRRSEAEAYYREALAGYRRTLGEDHPRTLNVVSNVGAVLIAQGRAGEAEPWFRKALEGRRRVLGNAHPDTLMSASNMGALLDDLSRDKEALAFQREALEGRRQVLGSEDPDTLRSANNLGVLLLKMKRTEEAMVYYREALEGRRRALGNEHPSTIQSINNMGYILQQKQRKEEAVQYFREALERSRLVLGEFHPTRLVILNNKSGILQALGQVDEAVTLSAQAVSGARATLAPDHWHLAAFLSRHASVLAALGRFEEAEEAVLESHDIFEAALGPDHPRTVDVVERMISIYGKWHAAAPNLGHDESVSFWQNHFATVDAGQAMPAD